MSILFSRKSLYYNIGALLRTLSLKVCFKKEEFKYAKDDDDFNDDYRPQLLSNRHALESGVVEVPYFAQ